MFAYVTTIVMYIVRTEIYIVDTTMYVEWSRVCDVRITSDDFDGP